VKLTGESALVDHVAADEYKETFLELIKGKGYVPEQVFNADELALFWKKMLNCTFISKEERHPSFAKSAKDYLTLLFCANAAGHMLKPGLGYKVANPHLLEGKNKLGASLLDEQ